MSKVMKAIDAECPRQAGRADHTGGGAREDGSDRFQARQSGADRVAVGLHDAQTADRQFPLQAAQMLHHQRARRRR